MINDDIKNALGLGEHLEPCPFCGQAPTAPEMTEHAIGGGEYILTLWRVMCMCGIGTPWHNASGKAIQQWNRRKQ